MKLDPIAAVEACYAPVADEEAWLGDVLRALEPIDQGLGLYATRFDASAPDRLRIDPKVVTLNADERWYEQANQSTIEGDPALIRALYTGPGVIALASHRARRAFRALGLRGHVGQELPPLAGGCDVLGMFAHDVDGRGVCIGIPLAQGAAVPGPRVRHALGAIAAHLTSARRLRKLAPTPQLADAASADAVLDATGRVSHAIGTAKTREARRELTCAFRAVERARGVARKVSPEEALALWQALVGGTWSLIDAIDTDGKRLVLARRNAPGVREPKALTQPERDVLAYAVQGHANKYIAYLLGLGPSTVASHLASAQRKLGIRSRAELVRTFAVRSGLDRTGTESV